MTITLERPARGGSYGVILTRKDIDRFGHNDLFAAELIAAFAITGQAMRSLDYRAQPSEVLAALMDKACRFFLCFNGFGTELRRPTGIPGQMDSAFEFFRKPLFDLMHDCPAHETMSHQLTATFARRHLLATDYGYAGLARGLGFPSVHFVPSITFPASFGQTSKPLRERSMDILLPIGLAAPDFAQRRHHKNGGIKSRIYSDIFEAVGAAAAANLRLDPLVELLGACGETGITLDFRRADDRFLLTTILDFVKFERRRRLLHAIAGIPVTVMGDRPVKDLPSGSRISFIEARPAQDLLAAMGEARCVICPTPHMTGFHERVLGAFTAGSLVLSSPNSVIESSFVHRSDLLFYRTAEEAAEVIDSLLRHPDQLQTMAENGYAKAARDFAPIRLAETILSLLDLQEGEPSI